MLGVEKRSAAETILLVNWQPANTLITKFLYGRENKLAAEPFVLPVKGAAGGAACALRSAAAANAQHFQRPKSWESPQKETRSSRIRANLTGSLSRWLPLFHAGD